MAIFYLPFCKIVNFALDFIHSSYFRDNENLGKIFILCKEVDWR